MAKWVKLSDWFEYMQSHGEPERLYIKYRPNKAETTLYEKETGVHVPQHLETDSYLGGWHPFAVSQRSVKLISHKATYTQIKFQGEMGYLHGGKALLDYCKACYSSTDLKAKAMCLTKEILERILCEYLKFTTGEQYYWLATGFHTQSVHGLFSAYKDSIKQEVLVKENHSWLFKDDEYSIGLPVRPVIMLPEDVYVEVENNDGRSLQESLEIKREKNLILK